MGIQKFRADKAGEKQKNGATPYYTNWMGGPTLALIRDCVCKNAKLSPRTVYITGEADTYFSLPAACRYKGKTIKGFVMTHEDEYVFHAYLSDVEENNIQKLEQGTI